MKRYTKNSIQITEYTSLNEFLTDITSKPNNRFFEDRHSSEKVEPSNKHEKWYNSYNFKLLLNFSRCKRLHRYSVRYNRPERRNNSRCV